MSDTYESCTISGRSFREECILILLEKLANQYTFMGKEMFCAMIKGIADDLSDTVRPTENR